MNAGARLPAALILLLALGGSGGVAAAEYYKWTDAQGVVHYGTQPPKGVAAETRRVSPGPKAVPAPPAAAPVATSADPKATATAANDAIKAENERRTREYRQQRCAYAQKQGAEAGRTGPGSLIEVRGNERKRVSPEARAAEVAKWQAEQREFCG